MIVFAFAVAQAAALAAAQAVAQEAPGPAPAPAPGPTSQLTDQLIGPLGALALSLLSLFVIWRAFSSGSLRTGKQVDEQIEKLTKDHAEQVAEIRRDRDWWRNLASESLVVGERIAASHQRRSLDDAPPVP